METTETVALYGSEQNELQNLPSQQTVGRLADGRAIRQISELKCEVTLYKGEPATKAEIAKETASLMAAYPKQTDAFMAVLMQQIVDDRWPIERVQDAVKSILRKATYPTFTIAEFMSYDKPMKLYTHAGYCWLINNGRAKDADCCGEKSDFGKIIVDGKCFFYLKKDVPSRK